MSRPTVNPGRREAFLAADFPERTAIHDTVAAMKAEALEARRALGNRYLERHGARCVVPRETAFARLELSPEETAAAREEAMTLAEGRAAQADNRALEFPVLGKNFPADGAVLALASSPCLLAPIVRYFGMLPVLFNVFVTRAHTTELLPKSAHHFHLDPEDVLTHKVFVHLTDVDEDCGPLHVLPADTTQTVLKAVDYRAIDRVTDEQVADLVGWDSVVRFCGPAGTVVFADTSRCLHFGGRPRRPGKPVRYHLVCQYLLPTSFLFPVRGDAEDPRHLPTLEPSGDEEWDALIGACHT
ncbi:MAG: hypothetical protein P8Y69_13340 [Gammaproteobacteria bacterium]